MSITSSAMTSMAERPRVASSCVRAMLTVAPVCT